MFLTGPSTVALGLLDSKKFIEHLTDVLGRGRRWKATLDILENASGEVESESVARLFISCVSERIGGC